MNYTTKTQYIFRINKQVLDENNDTDLNTWIKPSKRPIPFKRMIYIADGLTDVPCMRLVREYGGKSIAVYNPKLNEPSSTAIQLVNEARADFMSKADYRENKDMENLLKQILRMMSDTAVLEDIEGKIR